MQVNEYTKAINKVDVKMDGYATVLDYLQKQYKHVNSLYKCDRAVDDDHSGRVRVLGIRSHDLQNIATTSTLLQ